ncbi:MAG TPA: hypothetical protein VFI24_01075 [Pyrinomonadaceae bacterium]|nr:hypothetical protein [Pyrinomonadaceae bacterium]
MSRYVYTPFWGYQGSLKERLSLAVGGFDKDVLEKFYVLNPDQLTHLFDIYTDRYGDGPGAYARKTYADWKTGEVRPSAQTINRLLDSLPMVLDLDGKCDLLRKLSERNRPPEKHTLKVNIDSWQSDVVPLVRTIIQKSYLANLPKPVEERLMWLANGDMQTARTILSQTQALEGAIAVRLLQQEMQNIEIALANLPRNRKISHTIYLPYGQIHLKISGRRGMDKESDNGSELVRKNDTGLFKPNAEDIFDDVFSDLDRDEAAKVKAKAAEEAMRLVAEKKRGEIKFANASRDIANFVNNADLMDQRKKDYQMSAEFEGASGVTRIQVGRNWSKTLIAGGTIAIVLILVLLYLLRVF